jgi:hypothetical protein
MNRATYTVFLVLLCGGCSFEASCGKKTVKTREFEGTIRERVTALGLTPTKVDCGEPVEAKVGASFTCKVEVEGGKTYDLDVTVTGVDEKAEKVDLDPKWRGGRGVVSAKIEAIVGEQLGEKFGPGIALECGEPLLFIPSDSKLGCDIKSGSYQGKITLLFDDGENLQDVQFEPNLLGKKIVEGILTPSVREQTGPATSVTCGDQAMIPRPADGVLWCDISDGKQAAKIRVEVDEQLNIGRWEVAQPPG